MKACNKGLRFSLNPLNLILETKRKQGIRIGYMGAALEGFYLNCLSTGATPQELSQLLTIEYHCFDISSAVDLFQFLINEGDRIAYQIMLPYLLSTDNISEFEEIIHERFFGIERFVQQGKNLYNFVRYTEERRDPIIWINDLERGIIGWDMGLLVTLVRAALDSKYISKEEAWKFIEVADSVCAKALLTPEEIDKSFLLGRAMKSDKIKEWDQLLQCYLLLNRHK